MMNDKKTYEVIIEAVIPGNSKATQHKIIVKDASDLADAIQKGTTEWKAKTEPRDVRVKEIQPVVVAS
jgi:hypothetical protein